MESNINYWETVCLCTESVFEKVSCKSNNRAVKLVYTLNTNVGSDAYKPKVNVDEVSGWPVIKRWIQLQFMMTKRLIRAV